jgi:branched-chain amino acid transport system substrate-binding protein
MGTVPDAPVAADVSLEPIRIGMINQEDTPLGSFPEMRFAADAAVNWINAELGGVDGRPLELVWCVSAFSAEESQACAQELVQDDVVALVGGINVMAQSALPVLEQNGVPIVGGIPAGLAEQRSDLVFAFSGGTVGAMAAMLQHAVDNGAKKAVVAYGDFDAFEVSADYARRVGEYLGLEMKLVKFPVVATDFLPVLTQAADFGADAVIVGAADSACVPVMQTFRDLDIDAQLYLTGACAAEPIIAAAEGANLGVVFNSEGPGSTDSVEGTIFDEVTDEYNNGPAKAAGTVGFRGMMNLYSLLVDLGGDGVTREALVDLIRQSTDRPSFWGHPYTCDGKQVPGLPALCAPQQTLFTMAVNDEIDYIADWIDTAALFAAAID